jgi:hypothetical protein
MPLTSHDHQGVDFQGLRFLTGATRIVWIEIIYLNCSNANHFNMIVWSSALFSSTLLLIIGVRFLSKIFKFHMFIFGFVFILGTCMYIWQEQAWL